MRKSTLLAFLFIGGVVFFVTGGGSLFGLGAAPENLPDTITPPNSTFVGSEQSNPYAE